MANTKISQLTELTNPTGNEELVYAYNNSNGKMTLDTMKTYAGTGKQDTLVSGTNIKTINNTSLLGSGDITISGGGQNVYDAIVDANGGGDYTSVKAALDANKSRIFVKNGTYNHVNEQWDAEDSSLGDVYIVGESLKGVIINFSSTTATTSSNRSFILTKASGGSNPHSFYLSNMTINVAPAGGTAGSNGPYNCLFGGSSVNNEKTWRVENCVINFDTTNGGACLTSGFNMGTHYSVVSNTYPRYITGFVGCRIRANGTYNFALAVQPYNYQSVTISTVFYQCDIDINTTVGGLQTGRFVGCYIDTQDAGVSATEYCYSGLQCNNIYGGMSAMATGGDDATYFYIGHVTGSRISASTTVKPADYINLGDVENSEIFISCDSNSVDIRQDGQWSNSYIRNNENGSSIKLSHNVTGTTVDCDAINIDSNSARCSGSELGSGTSGEHTLGEGEISGCTLIGKWTVTGDDYYSYNGAIISGCKGLGTGQEITLNGDSCVFTGNVSYNLHLILGANADKCIVSGNYINSFETKAGSQYCAITGNAFSISTHSAGTGHVYANNID